MEAPFKFLYSSFFLKMPKPKSFKKLVLKKKDSADCYFNYSNKFCINYPKI